MGKSKAGGALKIGLAGFALAAGFTGVLGGLANYASPDKFAATDTISQEFSIVETAGGTYYGGLVESIYDGQGEFKYLDGASYVGEFADSMRNGQGTYTWANGDTFTGDWEADHIVKGTYQFASGSAFEGTFESSRFDDGIFTLGDSCEANGFSSFRATIEDGGIVSVDFSLPDGTTFSGQLTGEAKITYASGAKYSGDVRSGQRVGNGTFKWMNGSTVEAYYEGKWVDGKMSGKGKYHFGPGTYPYIEGTFVNGKPDGTATYYKESGNLFETTWTKGKCTKVKEI